MREERASDAWAGRDDHREPAGALPAWALWLSLGLVSCSHPAETGDGAIVASVGRQTITAGLRDHYIERQTGAKADQVDPGLRARL
jgi:hypothetical protein